MGLLAFAQNLSTIDVGIIFALLASIIYVAIHTKKYNKSVADFLAANRCSRRYLLGIANGMAGLGAITIISQFQGNIRGGFSNMFWGWAGTPFWALVTITGFVSYRMRETRVLTLSQFFEVRYSRRFRIFAGIMCFVAGVLNFGIFPAVGARFFQNFCGMPEYFQCMGWWIETYPVLMIALLAISLFFVFMGGQIAVIITDFIQGAFTNIVFMIILIFLIWYIGDWDAFSGIVKASAEPGKSKVNPFDGSNIEGFNFNFFIIGLIVSLYGSGSWQGTQGYNASSASAHETRMAGILGEWRGICQLLVVMLLPMTVFMIMGSAEFLDGNKNYNSELRSKNIAMSKELAKCDDKMHANIRGIIKSQKKLVTINNKRKETYANLSKTKGKEYFERFNRPTRKMKEITSKIADPDRGLGNKQVADQNKVPIMLSQIFPVGLVGLFAAMMIAAFISTHDTYLHSWGTVMIQDVIMPFRKKPFKPKQHIWLLRLSITMVAVFIFLFSYFFKQTDHIQMFFNGSAAIFVGGAGICIIGGLYSKKGTAIGAWTGLIIGALTAFGSIAIQGLWYIEPQGEPAWGIQPWLQDHDTFHNMVKGFFDLCSRWDGINWAKLYAEDHKKMPIQGNWISIASVVISVLSYVIASTIHRMVKKVPDFNLDKMLHRGEYAIKGEHENEIKTPNKGLKAFCPGPEYSKGDKVIYWMKILWTCIFSGAFIVGLVWNKFINKWSDDTWTLFWKYDLIFLGVCGFGTMIWFLVGGIFDVKYMFNKLKTMTRNDLDSGFVMGDHNLEDENKDLEDKQGETREEELVEN